eukprot:Skav213114  [mRNA]  locus=scaffold107:35844:36218:+ [translate_table: standard]
MDEEQEQAICELETFAVLVAYHLWAEKLKSKHVVFFLDNEGARYIILKGDAKNKALASISAEISKREEKASVLPWYSRVPAEANIADFPSRLVAHEMLPPQLAEDAFDLVSVLEAARTSCSHLT